MSEHALLIRLAEEEDGPFILDQAPRFAGFTLPAWRRRSECIDGIRSDLRRHLEQQPPNSYLFVAEDEDGERVGFLHLQKTRDFFTGRPNCHISDLLVLSAHEGQGIGGALLRHAEDWARDHRCALLTLAVFPGNERARALYAASGYDTDLLRMAKPVC